VPIEGDKIIPIDYSKTESWLSQPIGEELKKNVDVFFVYPTSWRARGSYPIADIKNKEMREWAMYYLKTRASSFNVGNIFAPYYRQVDSAFVFSQKGGFEKILKIFDGVPKTDVVAAFDYYIKHFNNGRPYILVGHSQGSIIIRGLIVDYLKVHKDIYERMIAAYIPGFVMLKEDYALHPHMKPAQSADDVGVIISYNVEASQVQGLNAFSIPNAITINPISWKTTDEHASEKDNLGTAIVKDDGTFTIVPQLADAKISLERKTIVCSTVDVETFSSPPESRSYIPLGVFHENDIPLYYCNLRQNAENRIKNYFLKNK
jgi:hypothetical protein